MKKRNIIIGLLFTSTLFVVVSCTKTSNDDSDSIEGTYYGTYSRTASLKSTQSDSRAADNETEWMHHLNDEHQPGDEHFGGFDLKMGTFTYYLRMTDETEPYYMKFSGSNEK